MGAIKEAESKILKTLDILMTPGSEPYDEDSESNQDWQDTNLDTIGILDPAFFCRCLIARIGELRMQEELHIFRWKCINFFDQVYAYFYLLSRLTDSKTFRNTNKLRLKQMMDITYLAIQAFRASDLLNDEKTNKISV